MIDKVQKIKEWISKTQDGLMDANGNFENPSNEGAFHILSNLDYYIDSLQEEPVKRTHADIEAAMQEVEEKSRVFTEAHKGEDTDTILAQMRGEEPVGEDLGEYIDKLSKQFPEVSFAKLSRIAVRVSKWQKTNLWKPAEGPDLPIIDREVIALLDNGKVVYAHRPPEYWDGKNIITGKVTRNYPKTYDKGGWNIPDIVYWLDVKLPKEIEL